MTSSQKTRVLLIAGWGRSGSTILSRLLGQMNDFVSLGEIRYVWDRGLLANETCGCGVRFHDCPLWSRAAGSWNDRSRSDIRHVVELREELSNLGAWRISVAPSFFPVDLAEYRNHMAQLYRSLGEIAAGRIIVDSSKFPSHGYVLDNIPDIDLYVVHLVRDPRGVAHSWGAAKIYDPIHTGRDKGRLGRHGNIWSTARWLSFNLVTEKLWGDTDRYLRIRYEDFTRDPQGTLVRIADRLGSGTEIEFFRKPRTAFLEPDHILAGNPSRFVSGEVEIRHDRRWSSGLPAARRSLVSLLSAPLLRRYGYSLFSKG